MRQSNLVLKTALNMKGCIYRRSKRRNGKIDRASHVILGHSERRQYFGENNEQLLAKTKLALANNLTPIFCVGEVLEERENGSYNDVVKGQVEALFSLSADDFSKIVIAYEPVWAIGTGKTATAEQAQDMHAHIRSVIAEKYGKDLCREYINIIWWIFCKPGNAKELFAKPDVDGGLIGGAGSSGRLVHGHNRSI